MEDREGEKKTSHSMIASAPNDVSLHVNAPRFICEDDAFGIEPCARICSTLPSNICETIHIEI